MGRNGFFNMVYFGFYNTVKDVVPAQEVSATFPSPFKLSWLFLCVVDCLGSEAWRAETVGDWFYGRNICFYVQHSIWRCQEPNPGASTRPDVLLEVQADLSDNRVGSKRRGVNIDCQFCSRHNFYNWSFISGSKLCTKDWFQKSCG